MCGTAKPRPFQCTVVDMHNEMRRSRFLVIFPDLIFACKHRLYYLVGTPYPKVPKVSVIVSLMPAAQGQSTLHRLCSQSALTPFFHRGQKRVMPGMPLHSIFRPALRL